jgi:hypothetical protein
MSKNLGAALLLRYVTRMAGQFAFRLWFVFRMNYVLVRSLRWILHCGLNRKPGLDMVFFGLCPYHDRIGTVLKGVLTTA